MMQSAAGTLSYLTSSAVPQLAQSLVDKAPPVEFTETFLRSLEYLMLAQAQECAWQRAVMGRLVTTSSTRLKANFDA